jgi:transposase
MKNLAELPEDMRSYITFLEKQNQEFISQLSGHDSEVTKLQKQNTTWEVRYNALEERYQLLLYKRFCRTAESLGKDQPLLFDFEGNNDEKPVVESAETPSEEIKAYTRKKAGRKPIDESLPRENVFLDISDEEKECACGVSLVRIGEEISERLQVVPARMWVERIIRPKYACRKCEGSGDEDRAAVRVCPAPASMIPGSITSPGLLSFIFINKYADHLPFYRQEKSFERIGIHISRQNMGNWQQQVYAKLEPLFQLMKSNLQDGPVMQMDETTVQVMGEDDRDDTQKSYMWLARGGPKGRPVVIYEYRPTRAASNIGPFLEGFSGYLQTDGYEGYSSALKAHPDIIHVGCFAHARRRFFEASKIAKKSTTADEGLKYIKSLYRIETALRSQNLSDMEFLAKRKEQCAPVLEKFKTWLDEKNENVLPSSLLGSAISYTLIQWKRLVAYLETPYLTPDNNASENAIRPFVIGRKNWLFAGSPDGAKSSCGMYSLIETAKQNNLNPLIYLTALFEKVPLAQTKADWEALLPWNLQKSGTS